MVLSAEASAFRLNQGPHALDHLKTGLSGAFQANSKAGELREGRKNGRFAYPGRRPCQCCRASHPRCAPRAESAGQGAQMAGQPARRTLGTTSSSHPRRHCTTGTSPARTSSGPVEHQLLNAPSEVEVYNVTVRSAIGLTCSFMWFPRSELESFGWFGRQADYGY
jgi:hypothetical protein